jgi:rod shape-determining protein MreC
VARVSRVDSRVDLALLAGCALLSLVAIVLPEDVRQPIASGLRRSLLAPLVALQSTAEHGRAAIAQHDAIVASADSLALRAMAVASLERENARLRKVLALGQQLRWGFVPAEVLHGRGLGEEFTVMLTAGASVGIKKLSPVIAPEGLVGMVLSTDPNTSQAIVWSHPDFRVSAMTPDGRAFGIVRPHMGSGASRYLLEMSNVPFRNSLAAGTLIVSSGLGGTYPRGIPIGTVMQEDQTREGWARTYVIRPAVQPSDVTAVMVLLPERVQAGVSHVWTSVAAADSGARSIAAAGDSAARKAAMAEVMARRAAVDSAPADDSTFTRDSVPVRDSSARDSLPRVRRPRRSAPRADSVQAPRVPRPLPASPAPKP